MEITASEVIFYILGLVIIAGSILTVTTRKLLHSAIYLLFVLLATAGLYLELNYHFLAMVQISVYIGGILVLLVFSIVLTQHVGEKLEIASKTKSIITGLISISGIAFMSYIISSTNFDIANQGQLIEIDMATIGKKMLGMGRDGYLLAFETMSILLLACIIGAILIAKNYNKQK